MSNTQNQPPPTPPTSAANPTGTPPTQGPSTPVTPLLSASIIHACLTVNSTTLYTYEDIYFAPKLNINYAELVSKNIGTINSIPEDRSDDYRLSTYTLGSNDGAHTSVNLVLYYDKKLMKNNDLIVLVILCSDTMLKSFVYNVMDKLMYCYLTDYYESPGLMSNVTTTTNFEYKLKMKEIIVREEKKLSKLTQNYGAVGADLSEVRNIMNDNIDKILDRGQTLSTLIDKTQSLNSSANSFRRRAVSVKRKFWWSNVKFVTITCIVVFVLLYLLLGLECGLPFYSRCLHPEHPTQPGKGE
ncbi:DEKNAAC104293 [Brettanomyces naardenensis]|uniref:DEKNAAC104293 n=1 Tax=Brettanomyces naardenensis TaxID=13370 RepID=A0A448YQ51_BRENA|nr:DEKNAAC104293 [Brettanomyces naardenensis]